MLFCIMPSSKPRRPGAFFQLNSWSYSTAISKFIEIRYFSFKGTYCNIFLRDFVVEDSHYVIRILKNAMKAYFCYQNTLL